MTELVLPVSPPLAGDETTSKPQAARRRLLPLVFPGEGVVLEQRRTQAQVRVVEVGVQHVLVDRLEHLRQVLRGAQLLRGPVNPSTNYECGMLIEGFDSDPMVMMTYNPPYYPRLMERVGMRKAKDLLPGAVTVGHPLAAVALAEGDRILTYAEIPAQGISISMPRIQLDKTIDEGDVLRVGDTKLRFEDTAGEKE